MKSSTKTIDNSEPDSEVDGSLTVATLVAGEDLSPGDFVGLFSRVCELPACSYGHYLSTEMIRFKFIPEGSGIPYQVLAVCLPFVYVKSVDSEVFTFDLRQSQLVRLNRRCAKTIWKAMRKEG